MPSSHSAPHPAARAAVPVIAIDGPTASGKGSVAARVAGSLGFHYLDSGALYRLVALALMKAGRDGSDEAAARQAAQTLSPAFLPDGRILLDGEDVSAAIRADEVGLQASRVALHPAVRVALNSLQHRARRAPGLVADGRDMGTVVFPDAPLKVFLTASVEIRAERRYRQLLEKGFSAKIDQILHDLKERDQRDASRSVAPLAPAEDALLLDSGHLTVEQTVDWVLDAWQRRRQG
ncbi:MAG: (d)CMP kinase [Lautropia sp.]|nr:(d)CMP kinase [Lautropia sp.]